MLELTSISSRCALHASGRGRTTPAARAGSRRSRVGSGAASWPRSRPSSIARNIRASSSGIGAPSEAKTSAQGLAPMPRVHSRQTGSSSGWRAASCSSAYWATVRQRCLAELRKQDRGELVDQPRAREAPAEHGGEALVEGLDLQPREVLERLAQHLLARGEPVGRRAERDVRRLGHRAVRDRVDALVGDQPQRRLQEQQAAGVAAARSRARPPPRRRRLPLRPLRSGSRALDICTVRSYTILVGARRRQSGECRRRRRSAAASSAPRPPWRSPAGRAAWRLSSASSLGPATGSSKGTRADLRPGGLPRRVLSRDGPAGAGALARDRGAERRALLVADRRPEPRASSPSASCRALRAAGVEAGAPRRRPRRGGASASTCRAMRPLLHQPDAGVIRADRALTAPCCAWPRGAGPRSTRASEVRVDRRSAGDELEVDDRAPSLALRGGDRRRRPVERRAARRGRDRRSRLSVSRQSVAYFDARSDRVAAPRP